MKKTIAAITVFAVLALAVVSIMQTGVIAAAQHQAVFLVGQKVYFNDGKSLTADAAPFVLDGRTYVPVRYLGNSLGIPAERIVWDDETQTVTFAAETMDLSLTVGNRWLQVGDEVREMDAVTLFVSDRVFIPARWLAEALGYEVGWDEAAQAVLIGPPGDLPSLPGLDATLPVVGSYENLENMLASIEAQRKDYYFDALVQESSSSGQPGGAAAMPESSVPNESPLARAGSADMDYSKTNVQVEGVDEADIVKTDGKYIYLVKGSQIIIAEAYPAGEMKIVSKLDYTDNNFTPQEIYVDGRHIIIIGRAGTYSSGIMPLDNTDQAVMPQIYPPPYSRDMVRAVVCDITDKSSVKQVRELELDGQYVSSRKIGDAFYLLSNKYISYYYAAGRIEDPQPRYRDSVAGNEYTELDYSLIKCFPGFVQPNYLVVAGIDLSNPDKKADISAYLGAGENIYASTQNLYVAVTGDAEKYSSSVLRFAPVNSSQTKVYKFALNAGNLTYVAAGEVPGTIVNQFSMDEYKGIFRIATTSGDMWREDEHTSKNNVYNLDLGMNVVGKLEGIAPGESIYSVRFMGDRGYMVTFKTVDPFFVIDLKDPGAPKVLGALKIPGYSEYLHPYDENHIIGFGKDTIEVGQKGDNGDSMAYYTGLKMAVFDVSDVSNPVEMFKEKIGDRGTESPLLYNHKALLFSREKNLLAFPVTLMEISGREVEDGFPSYGLFSYQGAYVYNFDLAEGFKLKGRITHLSDQDYKVAGNYWYDSDKNVDRIIYIDDVLYTLSGGFIKANNMNDLTEIKTLKLD